MVGGFAGPARRSLRATPATALVVAAIAIAATGAAAPEAACAQASGVVRGAVVDEQGKAASEARIILLPLLGGEPTAGGGGRAAVEIEPGADGLFVRRGVPPGLYAATATRGERRSDVYRIRVRNGRTVAIRFALESGRRAASWAVAGSDGGDLDQLFGAGVAAGRSGDHAGAVAWFTLAADLYPSCLACPYNAAVAHRALGDWPEAERAFREALAVQPGYAAAYYGLADVYTRSGRPEAAAAARAEAARLTFAAADAGRRDAAAAVASGLAAFQAGRLDDARQHFEAAVGHSDRHAPAYYWLGVTLAEIDRPAAAAGALRRAVSLDATGEHAADARSRLAALEPER